MRQHKLALCQDHYIEWFQNQIERFIKKYDMFNRQDRVLVAVSGGKDSLALWDVLLDLGFQADGIYIGLGIDGRKDYSHRSLEMVQKFVATRPKVKLIVEDMETVYGAGITQMARITRRGRVKPCALCGMVKRHVMNRVTRQNGYNVLATGHNLDDEAAVLFGNTLHWQVGYLSRQAPVLPASEDGLARKVKPFCRMYERETAAYTLLRNIDYIYDECPYSVDATSIRYKTILNDMERESPGATLQFYLNFLRARQEGAFAIQEQDRPVMTPCVNCGQPTTAGETCAFCRLIERVNQNLASKDDDREKIPVKQERV
jgi:uncharacterized protein (TIGR00269 family)